MAASAGSGRSRKRDCRFQPACCTVFVFFAHSRSVENGGVLLVFDSDPARWPGRPCAMPATTPSAEMSHARKVCNTASGPAEGGSGLSRAAGLALPGSGRERTQPGPQGTPSARGRGTRENRRGGHARRARRGGAALGSRSARRATIRAVNRTSDIGIEGKVRGSDDFIRPDPALGGAAAWFRRVRAVAAPAAPRLCCPCGAASCNRELSTARFGY